MRQNQFKITFEIIADDRVRAYINDEPQGNVRLHDVKNVRRLTYRDNSNPFKNLIKTADSLDLATESVESLLNCPDVYRQVAAAMIRSYLHSYENQPFALHEAA